MWPRSSGPVLYGWSPLVSVSFLNITWDVTRAAWCSFVFRVGLGNNRTLSSSFWGGGKRLNWNYQLESPLFPPSCKSLSHLLQLALLGPWRGNCTTCCIRPVALPLCLRSLFGKMFSAHKSGGWREQLWAQREEGAGRLKRRCTISSGNGRC